MEIFASHRKRNSPFFPGHRRAILSRAQSAPAPMQTEDVTTCAPILIPEGYKDMREELESIEQSMIPSRFVGDDDEPFWTSSFYGTIYEPAIDIPMTKPKSRKKFQFCFPLKKIFEFKKPPMMSDNSGKNNSLSGSFRSNSKSLDYRSRIGFQSTKRFHNRANTFCLNDLQILEWLDMEEFSVCMPRDVAFNGENQRRRFFKKGDLDNNSGSFDSSDDNESLTPTIPEHVTIPNPKLVYRLFSTDEWDIESDISYSNDGGHVDDDGYEEDELDDMFRWLRRAEPVNSTDSRWNMFDISQGMVCAEI